MSRTPVAFLGLGTMGRPMAGHLVRAGHPVAVWNRTATRARSFADEHEARATGSAEEAAREAAFVFLCLGDDPDVREVVLEQGVLAAMRPGAVLVDHSTGSAELARELAAAATARGVGFLDAPVSGGESGAVNGTLTVMAGGESSDFERALPLLRCYAREAKRLGAAGSGQLAKMVNQICIAGVLQGLSEGVHFALAAGLDVEEVVSVLSKGAAGSWQMENRASTMAAGEFDFGFAVEWMRKDLRIALAEAGRNGAKLEVAALVDRFYAEVEAAGGGRLDTSSLITRLAGTRGG